MEVESYINRAELCESLTMKLSSRPGSLELIERGVLEVEPELKHIIKSGEVLFRRVSSDEIENFGTSPSHKILKHQEALDDATARRLSLAAQQQRQLLQTNDRNKDHLLQISEQETMPLQPGIQRSGSGKSSGSNSGRSLVTGQVSRFKGLVFHNYCPAGSQDNQEARIQQQEKYIQLQSNIRESKGSLKRTIQKQSSTEQNLPCSLDPPLMLYQNKCHRCINTANRVTSLNDLTVAQLKTECRVRNLPRSGNKCSLINTLSEYKDEILAIENACPHVLSQSQFQSDRMHNPKYHLSDRSVSLPVECYDNSSQEITNSLLAPVTVNVTCIGGSFSNLPLSPYSILFGETAKSELLTSESQTSQRNPAGQHNETESITTNSDIQPQFEVNGTNLPQFGNQPNNYVFNPSTNPILLYRLPTLPDQEPAFIQTNGLEMIQLVQQELLRNIESQSQISSDLDPETVFLTRQHQRSVLINFLNQLIQKTPAFCSCSQLVNDQQKINIWIQNCSSFDYLAMSNDQHDTNCSNPSNSFLAFLNNHTYPVQHSNETMFDHGENDLLNLINEVVAEDQMKTEACDSVKCQTNECQTDFKDCQNFTMNILQENKTQNSPIQMDYQSFPENVNISKLNLEENSRGVGQKRAAWLQKVSPRLYKATTGNANNDMPFTAFTFDLPIGSLLSAAGSHTSSDGCGSINSSITDPQILSPDTEKVLFETIFQHTNSGSSMDNEIFSSTMNMEDGPNNL